MKTWDDGFAVRWGMGDFEKRKNPSNGGDDFEIGEVNTSVRAMRNPVLIKPGFHFGGVFFSI